MIAYKQQIKGAKYTILTSSGAIDALELAESCIGLWSDFIAEMEEANNETHKL